MGIGDHLGGPALPEIVAIAGPEATLRAILKNIDQRLYYLSDSRERLLALEADITALVEKHWGPK